MISYKDFCIIRLIIYITIFIFLFTIPLDIIESKSICLFYNFFGIKCFGCGLTRAFFNMVHLNIFIAIEYNPLILVFFPLIIIISINDFYIICIKLTKKNYKNKVSFLEKALNYFYNNKVNI